MEVLAPEKASIERQLALLRHFEDWPVFSSTVQTELFLDSALHLVLAPRGQETLNRLLGSFEYLRDWHSLRHGGGRLLGRLRRTRQSVLSGVAGIPADSVVFRSIFGESVVVASASAGIVVKLAKHVHAAYDLDCVSQSWTRFKAVEEESLLPELLDYGTRPDGTCYTVSRFCECRLPLFRTLKGRHWPETASRVVYPHLQRFHDKEGVTLLTGAEWTQLVESKFQGRSLPDAMTRCRDRVLGQIAQSLSGRVPVGLISGDLQPQNVLVSGNSIRILDWSCTSRSILLIDVLCDIFYRAMASPELESSLQFWNYAAGTCNLSESSPVLQKTAAAWKSWLKAWRQLEVTEADLLLQVQGMCWDWLGSMKHPWLEDGSLWSRIQFGEVFLEKAATG